MRCETSRAKKPRCHAAAERCSIISLMRTAVPVSVASRGAIPRMPAWTGIAADGSGRQQDRRPVVQAGWPGRAVSSNELEVARVDRRHVVERDDLVRRAAVVVDLPVRGVDVGERRVLAKADELEEVTFLRAVAV